MKTLSYEQLKQMKEQQENFLLVNVQRADIPGSVNIPKEHADFESRVEHLAGSKRQTVVVYCSSYECSASRNAAKKLETSGFVDVYAYEGGTKEWHEKCLERQVAA